MKTKITTLLGAVLPLLGLFASQQAVTAQTPTAARIAFSGAVTDRKGNTTHQIFSMNGDGSGATQLTTGGGAFPAWTRNQKFIAFFRETTTGGTIRVMDAIKGELKGGRSLPVVQALGSGHDWSPDDTMIIYTGTDAIGNGLWLVSFNPATGVVGTPVLLREGGCFAPKFSPDGIRIAFYNGARVTVLDLASQTEITFPWSSISPSWNPDGTKLAFGGVVCYGTSTNCRSEIVVANSNGDGWADGSGWAPVTTLQANSIFPRWSPDAQELVFNSQSNGSKALYKTTIGSGTVTLLYNGALSDSDWNP